MKATNSFWIRFSLDKTHSNYYYQRIPSEFPPPGNIEFVISQNSLVVVLDVVSAVHHGVDVLLSQYLQVSGSSLASFRKLRINTNHAWSVCFTNKDTSPGLRFEYDVHRVVDSVEPFLLVDFLRVYPWIIRLKYIKSLLTCQPQPHQAFPRGPWPPGCSPGRGPCRC